MDRVPGTPIPTASSSLRSAAAAAAAAASAELAAVPPVPADISEERSFVAAMSPDLGGTPLAAEVAGQDEGGVGAEGVGLTLLTGLAASPSDEPDYCYKVRVVVSRRGLGFIVQGDRDEGL